MGHPPALIGLPAFFVAVMKDVTVFKPPLAHGT